MKGYAEEKDNKETEFFYVANENDLNSQQQKSRARLRK